MNRRLGNGVGAPLHEQFEQFERFGGKVDGAPVPKQLPGFRVEKESFETNPHHAEPR